MVQTLEQQVYVRFPEEADAKELTAMYKEQPGACLRMPGSTKKASPEAT